MRRLFASAVGVMIVFFAVAQKPKPNKYPSVFWEITGNGLKKPSYLFGTMHVSKKMVFHLSDSFYMAIHNCDMVALELNPEFWQRDMIKMDMSQKVMGNYFKNDTRNYINEKSFQPGKYDDDLKAALAEEPAQINSLLYRTYQTELDFEENTYLDLYIYQTGRKFGKQAGGVEDYYQTEKIIFEASLDMAREKNKKPPDTDGLSMADLGKQIEDAYKNGDLDLLDSLEKISFNSPAYLEKFLYARNEIQANSIDTILKKNSLFVGVGAAHLPGTRGVIAILRKKGYTLRPIFMQDRDAEKKDSIDKMKVPVVFSNVITEDGEISMQLPGPLYKKSPSMNYAAGSNESLQYADMDNGSYYMLTRVKTNAPLLGQSQADVMKKIDSVLYEFIPGKIIKKNIIAKNGYPGYDIVNRTRRGDLQHYNIIVTPFEILVFKMSGNNDYVAGTEAETFFQSISIHNTETGWHQFVSNTGGFTVMLPEQPNIYINRNNTDNIDRVEFEATDKQNGNAYIIWKKSVDNFNFLEEDTFDLGLVEQSFRTSFFVDKEVSRKFKKQNGYNALDMEFLLKDGGTIHAEAVLRGPHYYLIAERTNKKSNMNQGFFSSFSFSDFKYPEPTLFTDSILKFSVKTAVQPLLDPALLNLVSQAMNDATLKQMQGSASYWPKEQNALFKDDSTGEVVLVSVQEYPKYYYSRDSSRFWKKELDINDNDGDLFVKEKKFITLTDSCKGYKIVLQDTNTVRQITCYTLLKDNRMYRLTALSDTVNKQSAFLQTFFESFRPSEKKLGPSVFEKKLDNFFADYNSKDSAIKKTANEAITHVYFGTAGIPKIAGAIRSLHYGDKDYFELKSKFIAELGYIDDSCCVTDVIKQLRDIYTKTADTAYFQNEVLWALERLGTQSSYALLKSLLLQDPPVFDDEDDYNDFFEDFEDSLKLAKDLFPDILQLAAIEDYKEPVNNLLRTMVDSGYLSANDYASYFSKIYFDAKIELKKQQNLDEKLLEKENKKDDEDDNGSDGYLNANNDYPGSSSPGIENYSVLLVPFYNTNPAIPKFFDKLLRSKDPGVQLDAAILLIRNGLKVPDTVLINLAARDDYRARLLLRLEKIKHPEFFPSKYKTQEDIARSLLLNDKNEEKFGGVQLIGKQLVSLKDKKGYVYFFKYKVKKEDDWHIGLSGIQPANLKDISSNDLLVKVTDKKLKDDVPIVEQFSEQLTELIFLQHRSALNFFEDYENNYLRNRYDLDGDGH